MTRAQMIEAGMNLLGEMQGTPGGDNPFAWNTLLSDQTDMLARATYCYHTAYSSEIAAGENDACAPDVFRITAVTATDADGDIHLLREVRSEDLDAAVGRCDPQTGTPFFYAPSGLNSVRLYPVPDYTSLVAVYGDLVIQSTTTQVASTARPFVSTDVGDFLVITGGTGFTAGRYQIVSVSGGKATLDSSAGTAASTGGLATLSQGGLTVEGYTCPGSSWDAPTASCPLPARAHMTVVYGAALDRMLQFPSAQALSVASLIERKYREGRGKLEREAGTLGRGQRHRSRPY